MNRKEEINFRHQYILNSAMAAEKLLASKIADHPMRQVYHVMPTINWMNDPCAMVYFKGYYHLFYQYDPYHISPKSLFFGHARSADLAHWETMPIALGPSDPWEIYDKDIPGKNFGIFTGSAAVDGNRLVVAYCGSSYDEEGLMTQTICLAFSTDGIHFEKYENNPILSQYPEEGSRDFRDPKLWKHDGKWYMMLGSCKDGIGKVLLYTSEDLKEWSYLGVAAESDGTFGFMWECPDFFELDGYDVLIFSPIGMHQIDACWQIGHMDYETGKFHMIKWGNIDLGKEFYAPQTLQAPNGRRIMMGWCNMWVGEGREHFTTFGNTSSEGWCGHMSLPRELHINEDLCLTVTPVPETALLRQLPSSVCRYTLNNAVQKVPFSGWKASELQFQIQSLSEAKGTCGVRIRGGDGHYTEIGWNAAENKLYLDRRNSDGIYNDIQFYDRIRTDAPSITLYTDSVGIELFADQGLIRSTNNIYPDPSFTELELFTENMECILLLEGWELK